MDLEKKVLDLCNHNEYLKIYNNPVVKLFIDITKSTPFYGLLISLGDTVVGKLLIKGCAKKLKLVIDEVLNSKKPITNDMLSDIDSIQSFRQMMMLVDKTNVNEKVILFARLYKNSYFTDNRICNDEYEEYLHLLDELSFREIDILIIYDKHLGVVDKLRCTVDKSTQYIEFISEVTRKYNMVENEIIDIIERLYSRGLCFLGVANYDNNIAISKVSFTTVYFKKFAKRISGE